MKHLASAVRFLTTLPVPGKSSTMDPKMVFWFPLTGLLIGVLLCVIDFLASLIFFDFARAWVDVLFLACVTGGLHLDGLADTADGVFSHRDRPRMLEIMRDPHVGVMGVLAIVFCLAFKSAGFALLAGGAAWPWLLLAPALGRCAQTLGLAFMNNARGEDSLGGKLFTNKRAPALAWTAVFLCIPFALGWVVGTATAIFFAGLIFFGFRFFDRRIGGMTGDTLGAMTEIVEAAILLWGGTVCSRWM